MGIILGWGDYGITAKLQQLDDLIALMEDLCNDRLEWDNILNRPELYTKSEVYNKVEIDALLAAFEDITLPINISDVVNLGSELDNRYTVEEANELLDLKSSVGHTHDPEDIIGLTDLINSLGVQIVTDIPIPPIPGTVYIRNSGGRISIWLGALPDPIPLDAVTQTQLATALAGKQNKLNGTTSQLVLGDGTYITRNKAAVGLGNVDNTSDADKPVSIAQAAINLTKADDSTVVHKSGHESITGVKDFTVSPTVPVAAQPSQAVNFGQLNQIVSDLAAVTQRLEFEFPDPLDTWLVEHDLGIRPDASVIIAGQVVTAEITHIDENSLQVTFLTPEIGSVLI